jgi:AcrR family transcriptional regulator
MAVSRGRGGRVPVRRAGASGSPSGGVYLSGVQQTRLLNAAVGVLAEEGVGRVSARRVSARAGMSTKTFYDLFANGEDCFLAVFERAIDELTEVVAPAWAAEDEWVERVRGALIVLLGVLERDPALAKVVFVEALGAGPRVLERRAEILDRVAAFVDEGRDGSRVAEVLPSVTAAGVLGAAFSMIHARLVQRSSESLMELVGPVMAMVVLPYRGHEVSAREHARAVPELPVLADDPREGGVSRSGLNRPARPMWRTDRRSMGSPIVQRASERGGRAIVGDRPAAVLRPVRVTERTCSVLASVGERPGANNRQVAAGAGVDNEPQISRLLARLQEHGLVENRGGGSGLPKSWWLTDNGAEFLGKGRSLIDTDPAGGRDAAGGRAGAQRKEQAA